MQYFNADEKYKCRLFVSIINSEYTVESRHGVVTLVAIISQLVQTKKIMKSNEKCVFSRKD